MSFAVGGASAVAAKSAEAPRTTAAGRGSRRETSSDSRRVTTAGASPDAARSDRTEAGRRGGNGSAPPGGGIAPEEARAKVVRRRLGRETRATRQSRNLPSTSSPTRRECETSREGIETTRRDAAGVRERETTAAGARAVISDIVRIGARTRAPRFVQQARGEARPLHYRATRIGLVPVLVGNINGIFVHAQHPELHKVGRPDNSGVIASDVPAFRLDARAFA